jgi:hypothetical protein
MIHSRAADGCRVRRISPRFAFVSVFALAAKLFLLARVDLIAACFFHPALNEFNFIGNADFLV